MRILTLLAGLFSALVGATGCARLGMDVRTMSDPELASEAFRTYCVVPVGLSTGGVLAEKTLLAHLRTELDKHALTELENCPADLAFSLVGYVGVREEYVPPMTWYRSVSSTSESTTDLRVSGSGGFATGTAETRTRTTHQVPVSSPGYVASVTYRNISVLVLRAPREGETDAQLVWSGEVEAIGSRELLEIAPTLLRELMSEFPERSGRPVRRFVRFEE